MQPTQRKKMSNLLTVARIDTASILAFSPLRRLRLVCPFRLLLTYLRRLRHAVASKKYATALSCVCCI